MWFKYVHPYSSEADSWAELTYLWVNSKQTTQEEGTKWKVSESVYKVCSSIGHDSFSKIAQVIGKVTEQPWKCLLASHYNDNAIGKSPT